MNEMMHKPLYAIAGEIEAILAADEWNDEQVEALDRLTLSLEAKAGSVAALIRHAEARADEIGAEVERLTNWRRSIEAKADWLKRYLTSAMKAAERTEIETPAFRLRLQKNPAAAVQTDEGAETPPRFMVIVPETKRPDKKAIADALKKGEAVPGWELRQGERLVLR